MRTQHIGPWVGAFLILLAVITLGDWDQNQGFSGLTPLAFAQDAAGEQDNKKFDHFACYEVRCFDKYHHKVDCPKENAKVVLFNQFTEDNDHHSSGERDEGLKVVVERLRLLCAPTRKEHKDNHRD